MYQIALIKFCFFAILSFTLITLKLLHGRKKELDVKETTLIKFQRQSIDFYWKVDKVESYNVAYYKQLSAYAEALKKHSEELNSLTLAFGIKLQTPAMPAKPNLTLVKEPLCNSNTSEMPPEQRL